MEEEEASPSTPTTAAITTLFGFYLYHVSSRIRIAITCKTCQGRTCSRLWAGEDDGDEARETSERSLARNSATT
eukprot:1558266-Rhodomonas_salina.1